MKKNIGILSTPDGKGACIKIDGNKIFTEGEFVPISLIEKGMTPDDANGKNFEILKELINSGTKIIVDKFYKITTHSTINVDKDLYIHGLDNTCGFEFYANTNLFNIVDGCNNIEISNIHLTAQQSVKILVSTENIKLENLIITDNIIENHVSIAKITSSLTTYPDISVYGISNLDFSRNICNNLVHHFFQVVDTPIKHVSCIANKINNFNHQFFSIMVTNDHSYPEETIRAISSVEIAYNIVKNDNDWWCPDVGNLYLCFGVFEVNYLHYHHNHVEGLKCDHSLKTTDVIAYSRYVVSEYNTWKNNCCFDTSYYGGELFSSKSSGTKIYRHNQYIVEQEWLDAIGKTENDFNLNLLETASIGEWYIANNYIRTLKLTDNRIYGPYKLYSFTNNDIELNSSGESWVSNSTATDYNDSSKIIFSNNRIKIKNNTTSLYSHWDSEESNPYKPYFIIENNVIEQNGYGSLINGNCTVEMLKLYNNTIINHSGIRNVFYNYVKFNKLFGDNNIFISKGTASSGSPDYRAPIVLDKSKYTQTTMADTVSAMTDKYSLEWGTTANDIKLIYDIYESARYWKASFRFKLFEDTDGTKKITYYDAMGNTGTELINPTGSSKYITLKFNDYENCPMSFVLYLSASGNGSGLNNGYSRDAESVEITTTIITK